MTTEDPVTVLAEIWSEVLDIDDPLPTDDFFDLGGNSVLAARTLARVRSRLGVSLPIRAMFSTPTMAALAAVIASSTRRPGVAPAAAVPGTGQGGSSLSFVQRRLWFLARYQPASAAYNIPVTLRIHGDLVVPAIRAAIDDMAARHEVLRTTYRDVEGQPTIHTDPARRAPLTVLRDEPASVAAALTRAMRQPFDLAAEHPLRATLIRLAPDDHVLSLIVHHIAADGWSVKLITDEICHGYAARIGQYDRRPTIGLQYADYARWQAGEVAEAQPRLRRRATALRGAATTVTFPSDWPRTTALTADGATFVRHLATDAVDRLRAAARTHGTTTYTVLVAALQLLLGRWADAGDVVLGSPTAGRPRVEFEALIGCFINTTVIRTDLTGARTVGDLVSRVHHDVQDALEHADLPFDELVRELDPDRDPRFQPLFQVMLTYHNEPQPDPVLPGLLVQWVDVANPGAKSDVAFAVTERDGSMHIAVTYRTRLYRPETAQVIADRYTTLLDDLTRSPQDGLDDLPTINRLRHDRSGAAT